MPNSLRKVTRQASWLESSILCFILCKQELVALARPTIIVTPYLVTITSTGLLWWLLHGINIILCRPQFWPVGVCIWRLQVTLQEHTKFFWEIWSNEPNVTFTKRIYSGNLFFFFFIFYYHYYYYYYLFIFCISRVNLPTFGTVALLQVWPTVHWWWWK